ncbi:hypothetical protein AVEN_238846-1 [Araneus ventricosus]|uniref:Uncharacterized protein n=1 Tax=Araneus ventricosus TaxID=182803 RepID=A0A4Y2ELN2_ARAVE|nr:hypothetical protein AVEN_238846-1 [Araneus ventricosus]
MLSDGVILLHDNTHTARKTQELLRKLSLEPPPYSPDSVPNLGSKHLSRTRSINNRLTNGIRKDRCIEPEDVEDLLYVFRGIWQRKNCLQLSFVKVLLMSVTSSVWDGLSASLKIGERLFLELPRVRLDGGRQAFRRRWGYDMGVPSVPEEDEDSSELSETTSLRDERLLRFSSMDDPTASPEHSTKVPSPCSSTGGDVHWVVRGLRDGFCLQGRIRVLISVTSMSSED